LIARFLALPRSADKFPRTAIDRRVLALEDHPVLADGGFPPRAELPEALAAGVGRQDLAHRQRRQEA
jgi:hypothetical protein